ncbi:MAG: hypothetical protein DWP97_01770 [Calditrichaeota bacterium]|nr:MAG: hypothetical protein DWP97_01770 [Calditrichota bacterium]
MNNSLPKFDRDLFGSEETFTIIGTGSIGGKASGLAYMKDSLLSDIDRSQFPHFTIEIPTLTVIGTDIFDRFIENNDLLDIVESDMTDERIAHYFQKASFPTDYIGDLRGLIEKVTTPLAVRSSSLLEDALHHPFAGVFATKMIPNNQPDADSRFKKLIEAIKFVYASCYFKEARDYMQTIGKSYRDEKMAVIIQEVVGTKYDHNYYPTISGVGRTYNYYPFGHAEPEDGIVELALGLGKTIVDGGRTWSVTPRYPTQPPPYNSNSDLLRQTQTEFWAVNMGKQAAFDPLKEAEFLIQSDLKQAEYDDTLKHIASTYIGASDKIVIGCGNDGPRVLNFGPILRTDEIPLINIIETIMEVCKKKLSSDVEIEFAVTIDDKKNVRIGFLQVRKMKVSDNDVSADLDKYKSFEILLSSNRIMGNGVIDTIRDIVYIKPEIFSAKSTPQIALEVAQINTNIKKLNEKYLLIGFGRWGSSDHWLGVPVVWSQISNAKIIVEATLPDMNVDLSQGAHFFHNLTSFNIFSFSIHHESTHSIDFDWLNKQQTVTETEFVKHVHLNNPLTVIADNKNKTGVIYHD